MFASARRYLSKRSGVAAAALRRGGRLPSSYRRGISTPHGEKGLVDLVVPRESPAWLELHSRSQSLPAVSLTPRDICDIELILTGAFSPLTGFMNKKTYESVLERGRLPGSNDLWPIPITMSITPDQAKSLKEKGAQAVMLEDQFSNPIAVMNLEDVWEPDRKAEADAIYGPKEDHPSRIRLLADPRTVNIGGSIQGLQTPPSYAYLHLRQTPAKIRQTLRERGASDVLAFHTRNFLLPSHVEVLNSVLSKNPNLQLLFQPVIGSSTETADDDQHIRVRSYEVAAHRLPGDNSLLHLLNLSMRMAGPKEALWHAIVRKNYGATHFVVGRQHAGAGVDGRGEPFYEPFEARDYVKKHEKDLNMKVVDVPTAAYDTQKKAFVHMGDNDFLKQLKSSADTDAAAVKQSIHSPDGVPEWQCFPEVASVLKRAYKPREDAGFCLFFTGFSGSGKTTVATALEERLKAVGALGRQISMLDGDVVRQLVSSGLGFTKEDRELNIKRIGYISSLVVKSGGIAIAAPIAPYRSTRMFSRDLCEKAGGFVEIHLSTPVEACEERDPKGLYQKARKGIIKQFTGINDPYEVPENPEIRIDTASSPVAKSVETIMDYLVTNGYIELDAAAAKNGKSRAADSS